MKHLALLRLLTAGVILAIQPAAAPAAYVIEKWNGAASQWQPVSPSQYTLLSGSPAPIQFTASAGAGQYRIFNDDPQGDLGYIDTSSIQNGFDNAVSIFVGQPLSASFNSSIPVPPGARHWVGLSSSRNQVVRVQAHVTGDLTSTVSATNVYRLDVGGNLQGRVENWGGTDEVVHAVVVDGSIFDTGDILSETGRIVLVQAVGDIDGDVVNLNGSIGVVRSTSGFISRDDPNEVKPYPFLSAGAVGQTPPPGAGVIDEVRADVGGIRAKVHAAVGVRTLFAGDVFGCKGELTAARLLDRSFTEGGEIRTPGSFRMATVLSDGIPPKGRIICGQFGRLLEPPATVPDFGRTLLTIGNDTNEGSSSRVRSSSTRTTRPRRR